MPFERCAGRAFLHGMLAAALCICDPSLSNAQPEIGAAVRSIEFCDDATLLVRIRKMAPRPMPEDVFQALTSQLGSTQYAEREQAHRQLVSAGHAALPKLKAARPTDSEIRRRILACINQIEDQFSNTRAPTAAVVRAIMWRSPTWGDKELLAALPALEIDPNLADEVFAYLYRNAVHNGSVKPAYVEAAQDADATRRSIAALALGRWGSAIEREVACRLLNDRDSSVKLRAAQGLLGSTDKRAVPALIELLTSTSPNNAMQAEELLHWAAGDSAPDEFSYVFFERLWWRQIAWEHWWRCWRDKLDLGAATKSPRRPGLFLCGGEQLRGAGEYVFGCDGRTRWHCFQIGMRAVWEFASDGSLITSGISGAQQFIADTDLIGRSRWKLGYSSRQEFDLTRGRGTDLLYVRRRQDGRIEYRHPAGIGLISGTGGLISDPYVGRNRPIYYTDMLRLPDRVTEDIKLANGHRLSFNRGRPGLTEWDRPGRMVGEQPCPAQPKDYVRIIFSRLRLGFDDLPSGDYDLTTSLAHRLDGLRSRDLGVRRLALAGLRSDFRHGGREAIPLLFEALGDCFTDPRFRNWDREAVLEAIVAFSEDQIADAARFFGSNDHRLRAAAMQVVGRYAGKSDREAERWELTRRGLNDPSPAVRFLAVGSTTRFKNRPADVVPLLTKALDDETTPIRAEGSVGASAAVALRSFSKHGVSAVPALKRTVLGKEPWQSAIAIETLGSIAIDNRDGFSDAYEWFVAVLKDGRVDPGVRANAALWLPSMAPTPADAVSVCVSILKAPKPAPACVKLALIDALRRLKRNAQPAVPALEAALFDPHPEIQRQARRALADIQGK